MAAAILEVACVGRSEFAESLSSLRSEICTAALMSTPGSHHTIELSRLHALVVPTEARTGAAKAEMCYAVLADVSCVWGAGILSPPHTRGATVASKTYRGRCVLTQIRCPARRERARAIAFVAAALHAITMPLSVLDKICQAVDALAEPGGASRIAITKYIKNTHGEVSAAHLKIR